jgi:predicted RNase H-like nuclease (RuvC/YqgF family)
MSDPRAVDRNNIAILTSELQARESSLAVSKRNEDRLVALVEKLQGKIAELEKQVEELKRKDELMIEEDINRDCHNCEHQELSNSETCMDCDRNPIYSKRDNWQMKEAR